MAKIYAHRLSPILAELRFGPRHRLYPWGSPLQSWDAIALGLSPEQVPALDAYRRSVQEGTASGQAEAWRLSLGHIALQASGAQWVDPEQLSLRPTDCAELWLSALPLLEEAGLQPQGSLESVSLDLGVVEAESCAWRAHWNACTVAALRQRPIDSGLPRHALARGGRQLINEIQMLWHVHPLNAQRETQGLAPINGLWLSGGKVPQQAQTPQLPLSIDLRFEQANDPLAFAEALESLALDLPRSPSHRQVLLGQNWALEVRRADRGLKARWHTWRLKRALQNGAYAEVLPLWVDAE